MSLQLPVTPEGFTRRLEMHLNFGRAGGAATYKVFGPRGEPMPFGYQYDTRKGGLTGFTVPGVPDVAMSWGQLREHYAKEAAASAPVIQHLPSDDTEGGAA